jgi:hypothetical protein
MLERFKELAFEKSRYFDPKRKLQNITRIPEDAINALGAVNLDPSKREIPDAGTIGRNKCE